MITPSQQQKALRIAPSLYSLKHQHSKVAKWNARAFVAAAVQSANRCNKLSGKKKLFSLCL